MRATSLSCGFLHTVGNSTDAVHAAFLEAVLSGEQPFVRAVDTPSTVTTYAAASALLPPGATVLRDYHDADDTSFGIFAALPAGHLFVWRRHGSGSVVVSASDPHAADRLRDAVSALFPAEGEAPDDAAHLRTWFRGSDGPELSLRDIAVTRWAAIDRNYPPLVAAQLSRLMELERPREGAGKLLLWHGEPGTGKTTALRALIKAWGPWCDAHYVADPEIAFADPGYLMALVAARAERPGVSTATPWRLIIAEDADEFLRADARRATGGALGRLLNLTDGILGQGSSTLVLLTTNEEITDLHPALIRPGRALARTGFVRFTAAEANIWLGGAARVSAPSTLADLYERLGSVSRIGEATTSPGAHATGMYL